MSIPTQEMLTPLVCVVDRDCDLLPTYRNITEPLNLELRFFPSAIELRGAVSMNRIMALVLDLQADLDNAITLQRDLLQNDVPSSVILTTDDLYCDEVIQSLGLGAIALLSRPWDPVLISQYLEYAEVQYREMWNLHYKLLALRQTLDGLTERQRRVLELAATGMPNKLIATQIDVSQRTVESERSRLLEAFNAASYADAMIRYGEYQALEQIERIHRRTVQRRLGMQAANVIEEPCGVGGR